MMFILYIFFILYTGADPAAYEGGSHVTSAAGAEL